MARPLTAPPRLEEKGQPEGGEDRHHDGHVADDVEHRLDPQPHLPQPTMVAGQHRLVLQKRWPAQSRTRQSRHLSPPLFSSVASRKYALAHT